MSGFRVPHALARLAVVLLLALGIALADWAEISARPATALLIVVAVVVASSVRLTVSSATAVMTIDLGPIALVFFTFGAPSTTPVFNLWILGMTIGAAWFLERARTVAWMALCALVSGALMIIVGQAMPLVGAGAPAGSAAAALLLDGRLLSLVVSFVVYFVLCGALSLVGACLIDHEPLTRLLQGVSWTRVITTLVLETTAAWASLIALSLNQNGVLHALMGSLAAPTETLFVVVAIAGTVVGAAHARTLAQRETSLSDALRTLPWPSAPSAEEQAVAHLHHALPTHTVGAVHPDDGDRVPDDGRSIVSRLIQGGSEPFRLTIRRGPWQRPFSPADQHLLDSVATVAAESLRVDREVRRLVAIAETDPLTGLLNYRALRLALEGLRDQTNDTGTTALLFLDIDDLRAINDTYGRQAGDAVLSALAQRLRETVRPGDTVARLGGDELAVLMPGLADRDEAQREAWKIDTAINAPVLTEAGLVAVSSRQTLAIGGNDRAEIEQLLLQTDQQVSQLQGSALTSRLDAELAEADRTNAATLPISPASGPAGTISRAIRGNRIAVVYQPVVDRSSNRIVGVEAHMRYHDPEFGELSVPFILAEAQRLGLMSQLDQQVLRRAFADMEAFRASAPVLTRLFVRIDVERLAADHAFCTTLEDLRDAHPDVDLVLELRQRSLRSASDQTAERADEYATAHRLELAVDDAGTQASEISALSHFAASTLKLDGAILNDFREPRTAGLIRGLRAAADAVGVQIVFEGVETPEQMAFLDASGPYLAQGHAFARPVTAREFATRLDTLGLALS